LKLSLLLSNFLKHARFIVSTNKLYLILRSIGESQASEGERLTSRSHGFRFWSII